MHLHLLSSIMRSVEEKNSQMYFRCCVFGPGKISKGILFSDFGQNRYLMCIFAPQIIKVFMDKPDIITNGAMMLRFQQIGMTFMSVSLISTCVCQAVGNAGGAFVLSISRQGVIYVLALFIMSNVFGYTGVLVSQACSDVVTALIAAVIMLKIMKKLTNKNE